MEGKTTKPWQLVQWKKIRKEKLGDKCIQCDSTKQPLVLHHPIESPFYRRRGRKAFEEYLSCEKAVTFCKKCAFLWDVRGLKLCKRCKQHYHPFDFEYCFNCAKELGIVEPFKVAWCNKFNKTVYEIFGDEYECEMDQGGNCKDGCQFLDEKEIYRQKEIYW